MTDYPMGQAPVIKDLVAMPSNKYAEAIYFNREEKQVICFSTQLSCPVGCVFCASPSEEKTYNLTEHDMIAQINHMMKYADKDKIMLFSIMGEGEPLLNYYNVIKCIEYIDSNYDNCRIALSTSGVVPHHIKNLAIDLKSIKTPFKFQLSLHSINDDVRKTIIPNSTATIDEIMASVRFLRDSLHCPIDINYVLIKGVNDSIEDAQKIVKKIGDFHIKISRLNEVDGLPFEEAINTEQFVKTLRAAGMSIEVHQTDGSKIAAACGQTRAIQKRG